MTQLLEEATQYENLNNLDAVSFDFSQKLCSTQSSPLVVQQKNDDVREKEHERKLKERYPHQNRMKSPPENETKVTAVQPKNGSKVKEQQMKRLVQVSCDESGRVNRLIDNEPFYHGYMARDEAEKLLSRNGEFLVRKTEIGNHVHYVISVLHRGAHHHILVKRTNKKRLYWVMTFAFKTIADLIQHHNRNRIPVYDEILLVKPVFKQDWQLNHEQVELIQELGSGQFGSVYKGWLQVTPFRSKVLVAVKTLHEQHLNADDRIKFLKEANLMLKLDHPNVVKLYGVCASREPIMIVMEYCASDSLENVVTKKKTSNVEKANFLHGAAKGLEYLHHEKIIHRDIAARNCLIDSRGKVKISDFGLSVKGVEVKDQKGGRLPVKSMAPETLRRGLYSNASDVYSFGAMMFEVYNEGREPFGECNLDGNQLRRAIIHQKVVLSIGKHCPAEIVTLFDWCRQFDPKLRPSFTQVLEYLITIDGVPLEDNPKFRNRVQAFMTSVFHRNV
ncbi:unnamed protein product [Caenorhabditis auriculariae]|uniref:Tyrosine-protein kinase n=1 Tax=Caenorhabditis auriculariae TaxID=2777116 RepID=A0A8S1HJ96_9PELO|nr:unnamed protein product [Caenorhabditis auriculariae]